jgi:transcriptional/translational regulatory protein YebC/TACO1
MLIVECLTDNPNRTFGDVRLCFTKTKCRIGTPGSVSHMFDHCAILSLPGNDEDRVLEALMDADVDVTDIENEDGMITVFTPHTEHHKARLALTEALGEIDFAMDEIQYLAQNAVTLEGDDVQVFEKLLDMLNELDDVQNVYHNCTAD